MQNQVLVLPAKPAAACPISFELYNQQHIDKDIKSLLTTYLTSSLPPKAKVLLLGGRCGLVAEVLLPFCSQIDIVEQDPYLQILEQRFINHKVVDYFFGQEGFIGSRHIANSPSISDQLVRVIRADQISGKVDNFYHAILVQNNVITSETNLIRELIGVSHELLITMMIPGKIEKEADFQFFALLQRNVIGTFYEPVFAQRLQNKLSITGRRQQIVHYQILIWKRNSIQIDGEKVKELLTVSNQSQNLKLNNPYEQKKMVNMYVNFHYGEDHFGIKNFPLKCAEVCIEEAKRFGIKGRALDLGCAVGRTTVELASYFDEVVGLDYSNGLVNSAIQILKQKYSSIQNKVKYVVGDACNLQPTLGKFNLIFGGNLIDRLPDPAAFVKTVVNLLEPKGILILTSPYSWLANYTNPSLWLGGIIENNKELTTPQGLQRILSEKGIKKLKDSENLRFVIKVNDWVYEYTLANVTFWRNS